MKQHIFDKKIKPACEYCAVGKMSPDGDSVLCIKSGVRSLDSSCSKFKYDIFKRTPKSQPEIDLGYTESDFSLK